MNTKRTPQQKLEGRKGIFLKTGIIIAMAGVLLAFQYRVTERTHKDFTGPQIDAPEIEIVPITIPKPPDPPKVTVRQDITITKEDIEDEDYIPISVEGLPESKIPDYTPVFQKQENEVDENIIIDRPEHMPEFPGGTKALYEYLAKAIRYPSLAVNLNIEGVVYVGFVIEKDGSVSDAHVIRGLGAGCDEEAVRAVESMPLWIPGKMGTQPVRVRYTLPVRFKLQRR